MSDDELALDDDERLVLGDLLNHVLDKGVVLTGDVTISIADIDLVRLSLAVMLSSVEAQLRALPVRTVSSDAALSVLPDEPDR